MRKKYFLDTCIWRDFYEDRFGQRGRPLGKYAADLFMKIMKKKDQILFSKSLVMELKIDYGEQEIMDMLNILFMSKILTKVEITKEEYVEAKELSQKRNLPFVDCLNAVQARNHEAVMVSQDKHFLEDLKDIIQAVKPEDIN